MGPDHERLIAVRRLRILGAAFTLCLGFLLWRLYQVQVSQAPRHLASIKEQSIRRIRINPVRGRIFARDGSTVLADHRPRYDLVFHISEMRQPGKRQNTVDYILRQSILAADLIGRAPPVSSSRLERHLRVYPALPLVIMRDLETPELARLSELTPPIPGSQIVCRPVRSYPAPSLATHVLGFTGRRQPLDEFERRQFAYVRPQLRGRDGLELVYDEELAGQGGSKLVRVDTLGFVHEEIGMPRQPRPGHNLVLNLDARAQRAAEEVIAGRTGALVAVETKTGAILAMASSPTYDLGALDAALYRELATDEDRRPLMNRAVAGGYLPGSIVKPLIALAALETGGLDAADTVHCPGAYRLGNARIRCWQRSGHGNLNVISAIEQSCNTFFIDAGLATGLDNLRPLFADAGIGSAPDLKLPGVDDGLLPSRTWARSHWGRNWLAIDTAFLSIGQGAIGISPLQAALFTAAIANGGTVYRPHLVSRIIDTNGNILKHTAPQPASRLRVSAEHLALVRQGMYYVVNGENATAVRARNSAVSLAGKTGTAEVGSGDDRTKNTWFICYGPVDAPRYAVAAIIENGDSGGQTTAPRVAEFFEQWLGAGSPPQSWTSQNLRP